jgi:XTP/dITP diphosphohydrolase
MQIVVATRNRGKLVEIEAALAAALPELALSSLREHPEVAEVDETGATFAENALLKARALCEATGLPAIADDSGIEVAALGGFPGVASARWAGPEASDAERNAGLIARLGELSVPEAEWDARFVCVIALALPGGATRTFEGACEGRLIAEPRGVNGFGYDPIFLRPEDGRTTAELTREEKNLISHRGLALAKLAEALPELVT